MLGMAAGMASCGYLPFVSTIGAFLACRSLEFIRNDICLQSQNVTIVGTGGGASYSTLGPTHHATEDLGALRSLPNLTIINPASPMEVRKATLAAYKIDGPVYLRLENGGEPEIYEGDYPFEVGKGTTLRDGSDITVISYGSILRDILTAAERLVSEGVHIRVINMHTIKPLDAEIIIRAAEETGRILTVEDHNLIGGIGSAAAEVVARYQKPVLFEAMGLSGFSRGYGTYAQVKENNGIGMDAICDRIRAMVKQSPTGKGDS